MNLVLRRAERLGSIFMHVQLRPGLEYTLLTSRFGQHWRKTTSSRLPAQPLVADRIYTDEQNAVQN